MDIQKISVKVVPDIVEVFMNPIEYSSYIREFSEVAATAFPRETGYIIISKLGEARQLYNWLERKYPEQVKKKFNEGVKELMYDEYSEVI